MEDEDKLLEEIDKVVNPSNSQSSDPGDLPLAKKLQLAIDASLQVTYTQIHPKKTVSSILKYELTIAEQTGKRGNFLEVIYQMLLTVPPTSLEAKRLFPLRHIFAINLGLDLVIQPLTTFASYEIIKFT